MSFWPKISLETIVVIDAIARHGSFAKAAHALCKVPSAVSYTVTQVEGVLGVKLFERNRQHSVLTPIGKVFLADGLRVLRSAADMENRLLRVREGWEPELRIAVDTIFGLDPVLALIPAFDALNSATRLTLTEEALEGSWEALTSGQADIVVAGLGASGMPSGGGYSIVPLGALAFDFAASPAHPLALHARQLSRDLSEEEVRQHRAVVVADSARVRSSRTYGVLTGQDTLTVSTMRDKLNAQRAGLGVGFVPRFMAQPAFTDGSLVKLSVSHPRPNASFAVAFKASRLGSAGKWFASELERAPELMACWEKC